MLHQKAVSNGFPISTMTIHHSSLSVPEVDPFIPDTRIVEQEVAERNCAEVKVDLAGHKRGILAAVCRRLNRVSRRE